MHATILDPNTVVDWGKALGIIAPAAMDTNQNPPNGVDDIGEEDDNPSPANHRRPRAQKVKNIGGVAKRNTAPLPINQRNVTIRQAVSSSRKQRKTVNGANFETSWPDAVAVDTGANGFRRYPFPSTSGKLKRAGATGRKGNKKDATHEAAAIVQPVPVARGRPRK